VQDTGKGVDTPTLLTKKQYSKGVFSVGVRQNSDKGGEDVEEEQKWHKGCAKYFFLSYAFASPTL